MKILVYYFGVGLIPKNKAKDLANEQLVFIKEGLDLPSTQKVIVMSIPGQKTSYFEVLEL